MKIRESIENKWISDLAMQILDNKENQWMNNLTMTMQAQAMAAASTDAPTTSGWIILKYILKKEKNTIIR